jgi:hypothetical protein
MVLQSTSPASILLYSTKMSMAYIVVRKKSNPFSSFPLPQKISNFLSKIEFSANVMYLGILGLSFPFLGTQIEEQDDAKLTVLPGNVS